MKTVQISLNSIDKVKSFVNDISKFDFDFDLVSGRYVIDAKSIMGIFSPPLQFVKYFLLLNKIQKNPPKNLPASHLLDLRSIEMRHKHHGVLANMMFALNGSLKCSERGMQMLAGRLSVQL